MTARLILRDNLRSLMKSGRGPATIVAIEKATGAVVPERRVGKSSIGRAIADDGESMKLDNL